MNISFDSSPLVYQLLLFLAAFGLGGFIYLKKGRRRFPQKTFLFLSAVLLILGRLPILVFNRELNADESQMLAQALTLLKDPVYWRSVDGTTGGPLSSYFLIPVALIRGAFDYIAAHSAALVLVLITLYFLYKALCNWFSVQKAAIALFPAILFYSFTRYPDFVHYTSEHFPTALLAVAIWLVSEMESSQKLHPLKATLLGILLALVPFGKIQALPFAAVIGFYLIFLAQPKKKRPALRTVICSGIATYVALALVFYISGVLEDFLTYYIQGNLQYKNDTPLLRNILFQITQSLNAKDMVILFLPLLAAPFLPSRKQYGYDATPSSGVLWLAVGLLLFGMYAISRTGSGYTHYLLFLIIPISLLTGKAVASFSAKSTSATSFLAIGLIAATIGFAFQIKSLTNFNEYSSSKDFNRKLPFTDTGIAASRFLGKDDRLVVWGWNCQYYVECAAAQGVAENHSIRSIYEHPMREAYQHRYLRDVIRNKPAVFIDATGKNSLWLQDTTTQSYRSFPQLANYIDANYTLESTPDGNRLFIRKDLLSGK